MKRTLPEHCGELRQQRDSAHEKAIKLIPRLEKNSHLNMQSGMRGQEGLSPPLLRSGDGEVPMRVKGNNHLTLGQMYWFFQSQKTEALFSTFGARSFTALYHVTRTRHEIEITLPAARQNLPQNRTIATSWVRMTNHHSYCAPPTRSLEHYGLPASPRICNSRQTSSNGTFGILQVIWIHC